MGSTVVIQHGSDKHAIEAKFPKITGQRDPPLNFQEVGSFVRVDFYYLPPLRG